MRDCFKKLCVWMLILTMLLSGPLEVFASVNHADLSESKEKFINNEKIPINPAKPGSGQSATDFITNPDQPAIYTLRTDFKVQRGEKYDVDYQPYIASVGAAATDAEKAKVKKTIDLPDIAGYEKPQENFTIDYDTVKNAADGKNATGDKDNGFRYSANKEFNYAAISNSIKIKHVFQKLDDFTKYTNPDGSVGDDGALITTQSGNTGSTLQVSPLTESDPKRKGFVPEAAYINMQVPENAEDFILEYRYNRAHYDVVFDTQGGTPLPTRTLYYGQAMPKIADADVPTKVGGEFQGWKPSVDINTKDGKTYKANEIIAVGTGSAIKNLDANLIMPANKVTFTAVWKDNEKAGYAVQFWAEKADHADGASILDKYDYIGTRVYKDKDTGLRPDLDNEPVKDIVFPDLDQKRLAKIWAGARFNRGHDLYLNKFYVYNQDLTHEQNKDPENVNLVKSVDSTGKTVYNIYYDRQVYELYFTKSNAQPAKNTFYPEIWGYDEATGEVVKKGGPGNPYHYKARFNQLMLGWPNDAMQTKGFSKGMQSFGWGPNYTKPNWPGYLDTPPYRLNADEFLDMKNYDTWGGYTKPIDKGDGTNINVDRFDFTTLSFGINQAENSMPHHMDFWMDGFKDGETIIRYDLYRFKADTNSESYRPKYPKVQGFTGKRDKEPAEFLDEAGIDDKNEERAEVTPFPTKTYTVFGDELPLGKMKFISVFFNNADEFGDTIDSDYTFDKNGYLKFEYSRNKYQLRFNNDPSVIKGDSEFNKTNSIDTFYEFPLKALSPDVDTEESYNTENPKNILDNPEKLKELKLTDLIFTDPKDGKLKVKRPDNLSDQMVFKGWALDPAGSKLIWENPGEKMPNHPVNLYAKWGEPDYKWKITFDPNGGKLPQLYKDSDITTEEKTIKEGDIEQEEKKTYPTSKMDGDKRIATVIQRQKLIEPEKPIRDGYEFLGWELVRFKKDPNGNDTKEVDNSYRNDYKVPELYSFGNDVVSDLYLKAIWVKTNLIEIKSYHHFLDFDYKEIKKPEEQNLKNKRVGSYVSAVGSRQNAQWILVPRPEFENLLEKNEKYDDSSMTYKEYQNFDPNNNRVNSYNQQIRVEPEKITDANGNEKDNPDAKYNVFHFFYRKFRQREYYVNYLDIRGKDEVEKFIKKTKKSYTDSIKNNANLTEEDKAREYKQFLTDQKKKFEEITKKYSIIDQEKVTNGNRHMDARNFRPIDGWVLDDKPQQQLFFDINENTNAFFGINETGLDEINFFYKDARVIEVKDKNGPLPDGYVRVTFVADEGGSFGKDGQGKDIKELYYDVVKGLKSDSLPVPGELKEGETKVDDKYYITPDNGKKFIEWDKQKLLNDNTIIEKDYTFTAQYDWSDVHAKSKGLVKTEAFNDPNSTWTNSFAPTIDELKAQIVKTDASGNEVALPPDATVTIVDDAGKELTQEDIYEKVKEMSTLDTNELVRTVKFKAKVTFAGNQADKIVDIPVTIYKNVYEALTNGDMPKVLKDATTAPDGDLVDVTGEYVKVTVNPTNKPTNKDAKIYYVNKNAWVEIPEIKLTDKEKADLGFTNWTANVDAQNENGEKNGNYDFTKRHKFTKDTVISPGFAKDVVEQEKGKDKPKVPDNYVKVIVTTKEKDQGNGTFIEKATDGTAFEKTFWVNPSKEVTIDVKNPTGKTETADLTAGTQAKAWIFEKWGSNEATARTWKDVIKAKFETETKISANYKLSDNIIGYDPEEPISRPKGYVRVKFEADEGLTLSKVQFYYVKQNSGVKLSDLSYPEVKEKTGYKFKEWDKKDTTLVEAEDITVTAKATKLDSVIPANGTNTKPKGYIEVTFKIKDEYANNGELKGNTKYFVKPKEYVKMNPPGTEAKTGYEFGAWNEDTTIPTVYEKDTTIEASFNQLKSVYTEKKPGYVKVTFAIEGDGGKILSGQTREYYVDPNREVTLTPPTTKANTGYEFDSWDKDATQETKYETETTIKGKFKKLDDIIPGKTGGTPNAKPEGYVTVTFTKGDHGSSISGETIFYVNPTANKTLGDITSKPTVIADIGYAVNGWDKADDFAIKQDITVNAKYDNFELVIPEKDANGKPNTIPPEYVKVTFDTDVKGTIKNSTETKKNVFVRPNTPVVLKGYEPEVEAKAGYEFSDWDVDLTRKTVYTNGSVIKAKYNAQGDISKTKKTGYIKVEFKTGPRGKLVNDGGKLVDTTELWVVPNKEVTIPDPTVVPNPGHNFTGWDQNLTVTLQSDSDTYVINAKYDDKENIILKTKEDDSEKPKGYVKVTFRADDNGKLEGNKKVITYFVNPEAGVKIVKTVTYDDKEIAVPTPKADENYTFENWYEDIDKENPITNNLEYVARFIKGGVTLTYDAGGGSGTVPEATKVAHGTSVRLASATGLSKEDAKFVGWKLDGDEKIYQPGDLVKLEKARTATAQWADEKDIIPYNPKEPITKPTGYVRVSFEAENGLSLSNVNYYYVKANKNLTLESLTRPDVSAETGYKFEKWDTNDSTPIKADIVVKAKAIKLDKVIPEKDSNNQANTKPNGYKEVVFVVKTGDEGKGELEGVTKFYVNPTEYVTINPPTPTARTGYEFGSWDKDATIPKVYDKDTTITGSFNGLKYVIPKTKGDESEKPKGYVRVTFEIEGKGGSIVDGETTVYFVKPNTDVTIQSPQTIAGTGYKFDKWDTDTTKSRAYVGDTKVKGSFTKLKDIIDSNEAKPDGYVTLTFEKGDHGTEITGQRVYYVNPKADPAKKLGDTLIVKPEVKAEVGYKFTGWDTKDDFEIKDNKTVIAQYESIDDVILKTKENESEKPDGYITVTFDTVDSGKGIIGSTIITKKVLFVNPNKSIVLQDKAPIVNTKKGYSFAGWDTSIDQAIQYKDNTEIKALYNDPGNISTTEVSGYAKVEFKAGANGSLSGTTEYWIKPGVEVNIPAPTVKPNIGWKQDEDNPWEKSLRVTAKANDPTYVITAKYTERADVIPQVNTDGSDRPKGYVTVKLLGVHGSLEGTTIYYVKPNKEIWLLGALPNKVQDKNADIGYTSIGGKWSSDSTLDWTTETRVKFSADTTIKYTFAPRNDVIERTKNDDSEKPKGYVTVKLIPTDKATAETKTEKIYFVNPLKEVTITNKPEGKEMDINGNKSSFKFIGWTVTRGAIASWTGENIKGQFIQDTDITAKYEFNWINVIQEPIAKENAVTAKGDVPEAKELIKNIPGSPDKPLPDGTKITYEEQPNVDNTGNVIAKVKVEYPGGAVTKVEVPLTVVDHVVPQIGNDKPLVPESYVKVTVDTTDKATDNTKFAKVFWVKPKVEVTISGIIAPTGKPETDANGVTNTNNFKKWKLEGRDPEKFYETEIKDTFTAKESTIVATYEQDKNVEPVGKNDQWIPQVSNPSPKDFIENPYDDNDPKNLKNLPPGTKLEFVPGTEPNTTEPGTNMRTKIKVTYPNGEVKEVPVTYNVTGDVVEQKDPDKKPDVPNNFVEVIVKTTEDGIEKATDETKFERTFWVNPEKVVTIEVPEPTGEEVKKSDGSVEYTWKFTGWDNNLTQQFKAEVTTITAQYKKDFGKLTPVEPIPEAKGGFIYTDLGKKITEDQYKKEITLPDGYSFETGTTLEMIKETAPDINKNGRYYVSFWVTYPDGTTQKVEVLVYVGEARPEPKPPTPDNPYYPESPYYPERPYIPMYPEVRYETVIQEKVVEVPVPEKPYVKEVRYMQGFKGDFRPKDGLTRAEAAQILANALVEDGYKYNTNFKLSYKDIGEAWYTRAVKIVTEAKVFAGYDDGNFKPEDKITRNEWIATLKRFQEISDASGNHMNLKDGHWAMSEIEAAYNEGWLKIYSDGLATYKGDEFIPREEVAAVSNKAFKRILDKTYIRNNEKNLISYNDVNKDMWSYEDILCASNTFLYKKDLYRAHWIKEDNNKFNVNTDGFEILKAKFQRNPR